MKKVLSAILLLALLLSLCACSSNVESKTGDKTETPNVAPKNDDVIEFGEPLLVWEDDNIKIELVSFYQEHFNWVTGESTTEKGITVRYYNKTSYGVVIQLQEAYLGVNAVQILHSDGSESPAPGKATTRNYLIQNVTGSTTSALESMDNLYQLDGSFWVGIKHDKDSSMVNESYTVDFSLPSIMSGESTATE